MKIFKINSLNLKYNIFQKLYFFKLTNKYAEEKNIKYNK